MEQPDLSAAGHRLGPTARTPLSLLEQLRANDAAAWRRCVSLYAPLVRFWCEHGGLRGPDAEDVTQEVFAAAATGLPGFRRDRPGDTFRGWLRGITRNQVLMHLRRDRGRKHADGGSAAWANLQEIADPLPEPVAGEDGEMSEVYRRALEQVRGEFPEHVWQAFWLTTVEGRAPAALAGDLDMTINHIRQAKSRVLRRLREELGELFD
jgi:RNA polymerase sigma-70 factor (ECF subfamily)